ncbi:MAG: hypothetical protein ACF8Q5_01485 [Phycisphaerales bacterium JB040]
MNGPPAVSGSESSRNPEKGVLVELAEWLADDPVASTIISWCLSLPVLAGGCAMFGVLVRFLAARGYEQRAAELMNGHVRGYDWYADPIRWHHASTGLLVLAMVFGMLYIAKSIRSLSGRPS